MKIIFAGVTVFEFALDFSLDNKDILHNHDPFFLQHPIVAVYHDLYDMALNLDQIALMYVIFLSNIFQINFLVQIKITSI